MPRERLTAKEIQVADLVWQGLTNREIGKIMGTYIRQAGRMESS